MVLAPSVAGLFKWRQFEPEVILLAVGWYLRFSLSYRDVEAEVLQLFDFAEKPLAFAILIRRHLCGAREMGVRFCRSIPSTSSIGCIVESRGGWLPHLE